jgi:PAS domain S-box-containing protein
MGEIVAREEERDVRRWFGEAPLHCLELLDVMPIAAVVWHLEDLADPGTLRLVFANRTAERVLGVELDPPLASGSRRIVPELDRQRMALYADVARTGESRELGLVTYPDPDGGGCASGDPRTFSLRAVALSNHLVGVLFEDVTARVRAADDLRESAKFLDSIIENTSDIVTVKEASSLRFERVNRAGEELMGRSREALVGKSDIEIRDPDSAKASEDKDRDALRRSAVVEIVEEPFETKRGRRVLHTKKIPIIDEAGRPRRLLTISQDITERKRQDEALRRAYEELEIRVGESAANLAAAKSELQRRICECERLEAALRQSEEALREVQKFSAGR